MFKNSLFDDYIPHRETCTFPQNFIVPSLLEIGLVLEKDLQKSSMYFSLTLLSLVENHGLLIEQSRIFFTLRCSVSGFGLVVMMKIKIKMCKTGTANKLSEKFT